MDGQSPKSDLDAALSMDQQQEGQVSEISFDNVKAFCPPAAGPSVSGSSIDSGSHVKPISTNDNPFNNIVQCSKQIEIQRESVEMD
jgi:hypothetical protein